MLVANEKPTGTSYTTAVASLTVAFIFIPAVLMVSRPLGYISLSVGILCSVICTGLAWISWTKSLQLSISSIVYRRTDTK